MSAEAQSGSREARRPPVNTLPRIQSKINQALQKRLEAQSNREARGLPRTTSPPALGEVSDTELVTYFEESIME